MRWKGEAYIPLEYFPANVDKYNFYAIHGTDKGSESQRVYKSFKPVPGEHPDFHRLEYFANITIEDSNLLSKLNIRPVHSVKWRTALKGDETAKKSEK